MELSRRRPEVIYYFTSEEKGFDLIEAIRPPGKEPTPLKASG